MRDFAKLLPLIACLAVSGFASDCSKEPFTRWCISKQRCLPFRELCPAAEGEAEPPRLYAAQNPDGSLRIIRAQDNCGAPCQNYCGDLEVTPTIHDGRGEVMEVHSERPPGRDCCNVCQYLACYWGGCSSVSCKSDYDCSVNGTGCGYDCGRCDTIAGFCMSGCGGQCPDQCGPPCGCGVLGMCAKV